MANDSSEVAPNTLSLVFLEALYADYLRDPNSVPPDYRSYFSELEHDDAFRRSPQIGPSFKPSSVFNPNSRSLNGNGAASGHNGHAGLAPATNGAAAVAGGVSDMAVRQDRARMERGFPLRGG